MHDLSIRKLPGVGRVNERLLESIGVKVSSDTCAIIDYMCQSFFFNRRVAIFTNIELRYGC